jgi:hypothetical protein
MTHCGGLKAVQTVLAYIEHKLLSRLWHGLAAKKRKEAQTQIPITHFLRHTFIYRFTFC